MPQNNLRDQINALLPEALKKQIKEIQAKFATTPPPPAATTTPPATPAVTPPPAPPAPPASNSIPLVDGSSLTCAGPVEEGAAVQLITPDGAMVAPDGTYNGVDGSVYTVVSGLITEMVPATPTPPATPPVSPDMAAQMAAMTDAVTKLTSEVADYKAKFSALEKDHKDTTEALKVSLSALDKILETPVADAVQGAVDPSKMSSLERHKLYKEKFKQS